VSLTLLVQVSEGLLLTHTILFTDSSSHHQL
jgi:hypothetical protein